MPRIDRSYPSDLQKAASAAPLAVIRVAPCLPMLDVLRERGIEPHAVIRRAGMTPAIFDDPDNIVPYVQLCHLAKLAADAAGCEYLGLLVGGRLTIASLGLVGLFAQVHADVRGALRSLVEYLHLHDRGAGLTLAVDADVACLSYVVAEPASGMEVFCDGAGAVMFNIMKALAGPTWCPTEVLLPRTPPVDRRPYAEFFKAPVRFEGGVAALVFPGGWLDRQVQTANAEYQRLLQRWVIAMDDQRPGRFHVQVERAMRTLILTGRPTIDNLAVACALTARVLSRRLAAEGTSFRTLLERTRFDLARQLLAGSDQPIERIAVTIGYAEPAAFMHAFRRWSGQPPAEWRRAATRR